MQWCVRPLLFRPTSSLHPRGGGPRKLAHFVILSLSRVVAAACSGGCTGPGTKFCKGCATGYKKDESGDCIDINECAEGSFECDKGKHCENTAGNYTCANCDVSCHKDDGCTAAGPTGCAEKSCADGYEFLEETGCTGEAADPAPLSVFTPPHPTPDLLWQTPFCGLRTA